jgi:hypothetical protein
MEKNGNFIRPMELRTADCIHQQRFIESEHGCDEVLMHGQNVSFYFTLSITLCAAEVTMVTTFCIIH